MTLEVFYELWRRADRYDQTRGKLTTYLMLLTRSRAIDRLRQRRVLTTRLPLEGMSEPVCGEPTPLEHVQVQERRVHVDTAIGRLNSKHSEPIRMSFLAGLSHGEIAERLQLPLGTVKTRIRNGLVQLHGLLHPL